MEDFEREKLEKQIKLFKTLKIISILLLVGSILGCIIIGVNLGLTIVSGTETVATDEELEKLLEDAINNITGVFLLLSFLLEIGMAGTIVFSIFTSKKKRQLYSGR